MNPTTRHLVMALALAAAACSKTTTAPTVQKTCADFCGAGNTCDATGQCVPLACQPSCGPGTACQMGACVPVAAVTCTATYPGCSACDTTGATPAWKGLCGSGTTCGASDACVPLACEPTCGPGTACEMGTCVPVAALTCTTTYPGCSACDTTGAAPAWKGLCGTGTTCDATSDRCVPAPTTVHAAMALPGLPLAGPFATPYAATAACLGCHEASAMQVMASQHWSWAGPTPDLVSMTDLTTILNPGTLGKATLVNNFCVATPSNDKRCDQCHAGYGGDPDAAKAQKSARAYTLADSSIPLDQRVDCLVCHADATKYSKAPKDFGRPPATVDLVAAVQSIGLPKRANCGACHFYAGGGDNVKLMGSSLKDPTEAIDVHMGRGMTCADCHAAPDHDFKGAGVHTPAHRARVSCADCHGTAPHEGKLQSNGDLFDRHADVLACQVCHIPRFSRGQFGKVDWDWSTSGDNKTCAGSPGTCVSGVVTTKVADDGTADPTSASAVVTYDYIKGNFVWKRNIVPAYRWYNGKMTHATLADRAEVGTRGLTSADADRITLGEPVGSPGNGKIMPFKLMRGRQAFYVNGADGFVAAPNVFGTGSFWGTVQAVGYDFSTYDFDGAGPIAPGRASVEALWGKVLAVGSAAAGQVPVGTAPFPRWSAAAPNTPGFDWRYTKLYMDLNHEVAPKAQALGSGTSCNTCHGNPASVLPFCELYGGSPPSVLAITCP